MSSYTVIIPALNEAAGIGAVLDRVNALSPKPEVVVVDDGSTDNTGEIAKSKGAVVIRHPAPGGYGRSLKDGARAASNDIIAVTDADGTYPIERIPDLVGQLEKGFDMAVGARHGKHYRGAFLKMPARIVFKWLVEFTTGRRIPDINSGLRAFRRSEMQKYEDDLCNGFSFTTTITLIYLLTGKFVTYLQIDYGARVGKSKVRIIQDSLRTLQYITEVIATYNPLKLFALLSAILGGFALLSLIEFFVVSEIAFLLFFSIFFVGSLITFGMGVSAHIEARKSRMMKD
jgi:glycosyltransferase involved in cell wall biosynthesis